jgi:hypothetical protein
VRVVDSTQHDVTDATVKLDGSVIALDGRSLPIDPGHHRLEVTAPHAVSWQQVILVAEREQARVVRVQLQRVAAPAHAHHTDVRPSVPTGAWILGGAVVAALGSFAYFAIAATHERGKLETRCAPMCSDEQVQPSRNHALVADISLASALVLLAGGAAWTVLARDEPGQQSARLAIAPTRDGVVGAMRVRF